MPTEQEESARVWLTQAIKDAQDAAFEAGIAFPFIDAKYVERRQQLAQDAQDAAHEAAEHAQMAENHFYKGDYAAVIEASRKTRECFEKAREVTKLAAIDESELYRCPNCKTQVGRFSERAEPFTPLPDGTRLWAKRFQCLNCGTHWRETYTSANVLIERTVE